MKYKDYEAVINYSDEDETFIGEVINTKDMLVFDGHSVREIEKSFHAVIDEYLEDCATENKEPDKPFSGKLILRISPDLHRKLYVEAKKHNKSLNALLSEQLNNI